MLDDRDEFLPEEETELAVLERANNFMVSVIYCVALSAGFWTALFFGVKALINAR